MADLRRPIRARRGRRAAALVVLVIATAMAGGAPADAFEEPCETCEDPVGACVRVKWVMHRKLCVYIGDERLPR